MESTCPNPAKSCGATAPLLVPESQGKGVGSPVQGRGQAVLFGDGQDGFDQIVCGQRRKVTVSGSLNFPEYIC